jgi:hypothetical protein
MHADLVGGGDGLRKGGILSRSVKMLRPCIDTSLGPQSAMPTSPQKNGHADVREAGVAIRDKLNP